MFVRPPSTHSASQFVCVLEVWSLLGQIGEDVIVQRIRQKVRQILHGALAGDCRLRWPAGGSVKNCQGHVGEHQQTPVNPPSKRCANPPPAQMHNPLPVHVNPPSTRANPTPTHVNNPLPVHVNPPSTRANPTPTHVNNPLPGAGHRGEPTGSSRPAWWGHPQTSRSPARLSGGYISLGIRGSSKGDSIRCSISLRGVTEVSVRSGRSVSVSYLYKVAEHGEHRDPPVLDLDYRLRNRR
eukprot:1022143-Prorocentrum_minimum.AAC.2